MMNRRELLLAGMAAPCLGTGLAACSASAGAPNPYLQGNFGPVESETTTTALKVTGTLPEELVGRFLRNGPNPGKSSATDDHHWFSGEGMVHGVRLNAGSAEWYHSRLVGGSHANTNVIGHAGRTLAIVESGGLPHELSFELESLGDGTRIGGGFSAHPKVDPDTNELHAMCYDWANLRDHVRYVVIGADGNKKSELEIPLPGMTMLHDMSLTRNYAVIFDLPVTLSMLALGTGASFPFRWDDKHEPRVGLLPRQGTAADIIWCPVTPNYVFHPMNAYDDADGNVVIDLVRYERMFDKDIRGPFGDSLPRLDRWTINPATRKVSEQTIDSRAQEFPRCHPALNGKAYRYGYAVTFADYGFPSILKHDLQGGTATELSMGAGRHSGEPVFVPRANATAEDDGFLITYVFDGNKNTSELIVLDALDLARPPIARVHLPVRIPYGFHGNWVPDSDVRPA